VPADSRRQHTRAEEEIILDSVKQLAKTTGRLMIAPDIRNASTKSLTDSTIRTELDQKNNPPIQRRNATVILLDTIGELPATYELRRSFCRGSIVDKGGTTCSSRAAGSAVVTGAHTHNFQPLSN
jgi:3-deoxy-D-manno-octulosonic-acid transferase